MNYSFHPHAEKELEEIEKYYDGIRDELGDRFRRRDSSDNLADSWRSPSLATFVIIHQALQIKYLPLRTCLPGQSRRNTVDRSDASSSRTKLLGGPIVKNKCRSVGIAKQHNKGDRPVREEGCQEEGLEQSLR